MTVDRSLRRRSHPGLAPCLLLTADLRVRRRIAPETHRLAGWRALMYTC